MRTFFVVLLPPTFDDYFCFPQISEPLGVQTFIAQSAVKAFVSRILPRAVQFDIECANLFGGESVAHMSCDELRPVV